MTRTLKPATTLSLADLELKLRNSGVNPTAQRLAICRYVLTEADHPTADEVKQWADKNFTKMSLATVYNTLGTLVQAGLLREVKLPHSGSVVYDCNTGDHFHFVDEKTGHITDIHPDQIKIELKLKRGFKVKNVEVFLRGTKH